MKKLIGSGAYGKVYDNGDDTVTKVVDLPSNELILLNGELLNLKYVARVLDATSSESILEIIKEKIDSKHKIHKAMLKMGKIWDESLLSGYELFDYIEDYLEGDCNLPLAGLRTVREFSYYYTSSTLFLELCSLVQELKDHGIYNVDFNEENFGLKDGHLALFELGGARVKNKLTDKTKM